MSENLSDSDNKQGWQSNATLQHFKEFKFKCENDMKSFIMNLIHVETPNKINMEVRPNEKDKSVEIILVHNSSSITKLKKAIKLIEEIYKDFF